MNQQQAPNNLFLPSFFLTILALSPFHAYRLYEPTAGSKHLFSSHQHPLCLTNSYDAVRCLWSPAIPTFCDHQIPECILGAIIQCTNPVEPSLITIRHPATATSNG